MKRYEKCDCCGNKALLIKEKRFFVERLYATIISSNGIEFDKPTIKFESDNLKKATLFALKKFSTMGEFNFDNSLGVQKKHDIFYVVKERLKDGKTKEVCTFGYHITKKVWR